MFDALHYWHWWVLAIVLIILEITISGVFFFLFLAGSAAVVGFVALIPGVTWETQLFVFALLSMVSVFLWRRFRPTETATDQPTLNRRGHQYVGRHFTLSEPIVNGTGKLIVADTTWKIAGPDLPSGTKVAVTGVSGTTLVVDDAEKRSEKT